MTTKVTAALAQVFADAVKTAIDAGSGPGVIKLYTSPKPATPGTAISTQTLLATLTLSDPCGTTSGGVLTFSAIASDGSADASGTVAWARIADSTGAAVIDIDTGSGALEFTPSTFEIGGAIDITALSISFT